MQHIAIPLWFEIASFIVLTAILLADLLIVGRKPHIPSTKESALWVGFYATLAIIFAILLWVIGNRDASTEFVAGWLTEYSLSIDNLFVFVIIMSRFKVAKKDQQKVLMIGVVMALVLRGIFILIGAALIEQFSAIFYVFGAFLIYTAYHQAFRTESDDEETESRLIKWVRHTFKLTPFALVLFTVALTDVMFAFDSIPAIFGITTDPFIVFTANVFALMGLRQLYFLLGGLLDKLEYLKYGIAFILGFIGVKLVSHAMHVNELPFINDGNHIEWAPEISTESSLIVIAGSIVVSALASLYSARRKEKATE